ncbi:metallophosphatase family protein [Patescibacteria group bacterium]|nr:metallophosphatase family protein [Patescibacteria group bacterium]
MKIAIISDIHDNVPNLEKALNWLKQNKIEQLIFCGDLCAPSILAKVLAPNFSGPIHMVFGNVEDRNLLPKMVASFPQVQHYGDQGEIELENKKIAFVHFPKQARRLAESQKYDLVFYGHDHKPWEEKIKQTRLVNPGTLGGLFSLATFAVYDTVSDNLELKILHTLK